MTHLDPSLSLFCPFSNCHLQVAKKAGIPVGSAKNVIIWGNHSSAQFPDVQHAQVYKNSPAFDASAAINDPDYAKGQLITVGRRN